MKALFVIAALTLSGFAAQAQTSAQASSDFVETHGAFVASECGNTVTDSQLGLTSAIAQICIGQTAAFNDQIAQPAVEFRLKNGKSKVFRIARVDNLLVALLSGKSKSIIFLASDDGDQVGMKVINAADGHIESAQGAIAGHPFFVKSFEAVIRTF